MRFFLSTLMMSVLLIGFSGCSYSKNMVEKKLESKKVVKFVMCVTKKDGMTLAEFRDYWQNNHGAYFTKNAHKMNAIKYVQTHIVETPMNQFIRDSRGMRVAYDGVAEVWFESMEKLQEGMSSKMGLELGEYLLKDEKTFINHEKSTAFIATEVELF